MEAKLQRMAAGLRRERDEAHRERELASERLRLAKEEEEAAGKTLESMKLKLKELEAASGAGAKNEIEHLKTKVENLENQVRWQRLRFFRNDRAAPPTFVTVSLNFCA